MAFAEATVITVGGYALTANRLRNTPSDASPRWVGIGTGAESPGDRTADKTDTALTTEVETRGEGTESQETETETGDVYQVTGVVTVTENRSIDEMGLFNAPSSGTMFLSATHPAIALSANDSIIYVARCQLVGP